MSLAKGLKTIVVATDLQGRSEAALDYARKLAGAYGARIILAHGTDPVDYAALDAIPGRILRSMAEPARAALEEMAADLLREGIHSHSEIRQGEVVAMLLDIIQQYHADLVVIGTRGHHGAGPLVVGSIAEQLVRKAPCAVLAVAADWNAGEFRPVPGGSVLLAIERNDATQAALDAALSLARVFNRTLVVVHARGSAQVSAILNTGESRLEDFGVKTDPGIPVRFLVKDGNPADAINLTIQQYKPAILIAGVKRRSGSPGPHGTIFALLASSRVPVLCVPVDAEPVVEEVRAGCAANAQ